MKREYNYTNDMGYHKQLLINIDAKQDDKYPCTLWSMDTGDFCGSGMMTYEEIKALLAHYGVPIEQGISL